MNTYFRRLSSFLFLVLISTSLWAAKPTIAVLDFDSTRQEVFFGQGFAIVKNVEDTSKILSSELITYLVKTNKFSVVERDRMKDILTEQEFSESGYISPESAVKMGKLIGADYFVMGKIERISAELENKKVPYTNTIRQQYTGKMIINVRIVDSRGGKIVTADKFVVELEEPNKKNKVMPADFLDALKEKTVKQLVNGIIEGVFPIKIIKVAGSGVYINRGKGAEFEVGTILAVIQQGDGLIDPDTGEQLGSEEEEVGTIKISEIQKKFSKATIVTGANRIKKGAIARIKIEQEQDTAARELTPGSSDKPVNW
ncbi:MAG: CsgG/HfaB family protein [Thiohalomonadales bacterium]